MTNPVKYIIITLTKLVRINLEVISISYESFEKLEEAKRLSIINAGFKVFADHGYSKASVEDIATTAGISKGSLFYYFGSKKNFLIYLYKYCTTKLEEIVDAPGPDGQPTYLAYTDFFERLNAIHLLKLKAQNDYPHMTLFMKRIIIDTSPVSQEILRAFNAKYVTERAILFFQGIDYSKFKEGIDPYMVVQLLSWCSEGLISQVLLEQKMKDPNVEIPDFDILVKRYQDYVSLLRNNFYKDEYL